MKRFLALLTACATVFAFSACGQKETGNSNGAATEGDSANTLVIGSIRVRRQHTVILLKTVHSSLLMKSTKQAA